MDKEQTLLEKERLQAHPTVPIQLQNLTQLVATEMVESFYPGDDLKALFPLTIRLKCVYFESNDQAKASHKPLKVGVVLSGGQAPGGHNVITGLWDGLQELNQSSQLIGFLNGPSGLIKNEFRELNQQILSNYRNLGGFDLIGSGRTKIETPEQFAAVIKTVQHHQLDGLVVIGGDDSNTNAALLAELFLAEKVLTTVIGVPKTIDGDLKSPEVEASFGFDTATKIYSELIGNIARDAISAKKYTHFIKIMGRSASHVALECALQTHPNYTAISEEVAANKKSLQQITEEIVDVIAKRAEVGKNYAVILIPEGLLEFIPECKLLIEELNTLLAPDSTFRTEFESFGKSAEALNFINSKLSDSARSGFKSLPHEIQWQLLQDRDPHGNVQVSKIETERLLMETVRLELEERAKRGHYKGKYNAQPHFLGYEGRAGYPSQFDCNYCYALGKTAALLIAHQRTGYMAVVRHLAQPVSEWEAEGIPFIDLMTIEERHGKPKPVIKKALVELWGSPFAVFSEQRELWAKEDDYCYPGPVQFFGPAEITEATTMTLQLESQYLLFNFSPWASEPL